MGGPRAFPPKLLQLGCQERLSAKPHAHPSHPNFCTPIQYPRALLPPHQSPPDQAKQETLTAQVRQPVLHPGQSHTNPGSLRAIVALFLSAHHSSANSPAEENSPDQGAGDSIQLPPPAPDTGSLDHSLPRSGTWLTYCTGGFFRIWHSLPHHPLGPCGRQTSVPHMRDAGSRMMRTAQGWAARYYLPAHPSLSGWPCLPQSEASIP